MILDGLHRWMTAWEAAMAEAGYPKARIDVHRFEDATGVVVVHYVWTHDVESGTGDDVGWVAAHKAFLIVDELRPSFVQPTPVLVELLAGGSL